MDKIVRLKRRKTSIRKKISGSGERPRLCIYRGSKNLNAQLVDDTAGKTVCSISTLSGKLSGKLTGGSRSGLKAATLLGDEMGRIALEKGVAEVVFDRSGYRYHGVIKAFAEAARKSGLKF
ncbi:MAG: 50S ribosomal protein L18 [Candidatus Omnitrophica bacterium]|nr:50S ribosomal protein L18 [Candidatus Omnitrophota bacterium]MDD4012851.1 50S ribosomal protein L18 [Candidatus Omnitrophota bacterium]